jgi:hypothetical protein
MAGLSYVPQEMRMLKHTQMHTRTPKRRNKMLEKQYAQVHARGTLFSVCTLVGWLIHG